MSLRVDKHYTCDKAGCGKEEVMKGRQDTEYGVGGLPKGWCKTRVMLPAKRAGQVPDEHTGYFCCSEHMNQTCVSNAAAALIEAGQKLQSCHSRVAGKSCW